MEFKVTLLWPLQLELFYPSNLCILKGIHLQDESTHKLDTWWLTPTLETLFDTLGIFWIALFI